MHSAVQFITVSIRIGQGTGMERTAITGLSNSCVPVIGAGTLDTVLCVIENGYQY